MIISGQLVDLENRRIFPVEIFVSKGKISEIKEVATADAQFILPGFIDAHVHIESSMLPPAEFARLALPHGTVATVSDPHEIANVCGIAGVEWMLENAEKTPLKIFFGAPSCVPATSFETAGATLNATDVEALLARPDIWYLTELMNYPGVLHDDPEVLAKIAAAQQHNKPVDGHAPGLRGAEAEKYAAAGISTDHECTTLPEALDKIAAGQHILIREGSAAKNFEALHPLLKSHPEKVMLCSDDKHPDDLLEGHINQLVARAVALGYDVFDVLRAACSNPVAHYNLPVGQLKMGEAADFILVENLKDFEIKQTWIEGKLVAENGKCLLPKTETQPINNFAAQPKKETDFALAAEEKSPQIRVIVAEDGQLVTGSKLAAAKVKNGNLFSFPENDILKLTVVNRYEADAKPAVAFISGFGLKGGALASTVAHDCHNIVAVGCSDALICKAVNALIDCKGGICVVDATGEVSVLPLPIAGLMSLESGAETGRLYAELDAKAKALGSQLRAPFMTLSFMALLVIPSLKLSDLGLFDGERFGFV